MGSEVETVNWISIDDRLPDDDISVLVFAPNLPEWNGEQVWIGHYETDDEGDTWIDTEGCDWPVEVVTHWAEMPAGPSQTAKNSEAI